ncbi:DUF1129 family protein [Streptococcus danieliae]|uniref:DUF1129 family protein n=1 Tax=Streptococcus danieliae TaxID=747656 RepID=A0A7Z0RR30_9STRE|nr:DUF1129 family protein [Streptococcus danieliae]MBF0716813.1 DUF1129 family protein [Streptococcus danieliae]NYS48743.1 DUF1129 family protein [Streptococcus danieliae]
MSFEHLTKKNQQYVRTVQKLLEQAGKSPKEIEILLANILPDIEEKQDRGFTARALYGTPTQWVRNQLSEASAESSDSTAANDSPWLMWLESTLFLLAFVGLGIGLINQFIPGSTSYGLLTLISMTTGGGAVFYALYHFVYRYYEPQYEGERPNARRGFLFVGLTLLAWIALITISESILAGINPPLPSMVLILIGIAAFALRWWLMRTYKIKNARINPRRQAF